jgi:hypothetical protein
MATSPIPSKPLDRFRQRQVKPNRCWYVRASEQLDADQMIELESALGDPAITSKTISLVLEEDFAFQISSRTINTHRSKDCSCE